MWSNIYIKYLLIIIAVILFIVQLRFCMEHIIINNVYMNLERFYGEPFYLNLFEKIQFFKRITRV